ncbi:MAG: aspartate/glutamate racemase family protein [Collinsella sp.]
MPHSPSTTLATPSAALTAPHRGRVRSFALQAGHWLSKHDVKIMVIACNTATAAALRLAQQVLDVPVIGVIAPGARAAINSTRTRRVGVLATNLTIRSGAYTRAIQDLDAASTYTAALPRAVSRSLTRARLGRTSARAVARERGHL